jgi:two-component system, chemotaxis family, protein-glutamate methylesterase/glutaminase
MIVKQIVRALVVDDSAYTRKAVREMLSRSPYVEVVGAARDGLEALEMAEQLRPDVVTCDLVMPRLDGPGFVRQQMARRPLPILIFSMTQEDAELAMQALDAGAVDFVQKPTTLANENLYQVRDELIEKVKAAGQAPPAALRPSTHVGSLTLPRRRTGRVEIVVVGISTGGPQALRGMLPQLPADLPVPLVIVLHMPVGFTAIYAAKLNDLCALKVKEAAEGDPLEAGQCLIAPAGMHLSFEKATHGLVTTHLDYKPMGAMHRPSVDVLFQSAATVYGEGVLGVVMTGMGNDGKEGAAWIKAQGGTILTEAEESCVIYGMPRSVVEAGLSDRVVPLAQLPQTILDFL